MPEFNRKQEFAAFDYGAEVKARRERYGITTEQVATKVGLTASTIEGYEAGQTTPNLLNGIKIMNAVGLPLERLNHWADAKNLSPRQRRG